MANITRIKNNQITDSTITYSKIASGTLVGSVFNSNLTLNSNVTILGNLSVTGSSAIINAVNTTVNDPLVVFNNGYVGSPTYDIGVIANRNLSSLAPYGSVNMGFVWKEDAQQWQAIATTETGSTTGSINNSGWANVRVGNLVSVTSNTTGSAVIGDTLTVSGTVSHLSTTDLVGATTFTTATGGGLQAVAIGNVTPGTGAFTSLTATGAITLNTISAASFQGVIGNVTPASGAFTTLTASGATTVTNSTASTSTSTGALVVTGGAGVGGALYAGTVYDNGNRVITGLTSSGNGNVTVGGTTPNLTVELTATGPGTSSWGGSTQLPYFSVDAYGRISAAGNVALNTIAVTNLGNTNEITANSTVGLTGLNLVATGVTAGNYGSALSIPTIVVDSKGRITEITTNALSTSFTVAGTSGTTSIDNGDTFTFAGTHGVTVAVGDTYANISTPQDLQTTANPTFNNLTTASVQGVIGNVTPASATFTTASTGGLQAVAIGNVTPGTGTFTTGTFNTATTGGLQAVAIGNVTPGTGTFTTGTFNTATTGGLQAVAIGNVTPGTAVFTTLDSTGDTSLGLTDAVAINNTPIGNATPSTGAFTSLSASGATTLNTVTGASFQGVVGNVTPAAGTFTSLFADSASFASINNTPIGNATPSTGAFTTLSAQTTTTGGLQAVAIGNVTPGTAVFTELSASTWANVTSTIESTNTTTGALVVAGGVGIDKNLNVGGNVVITGNLTVNGDVTTVNAATLDVEDLNITVAKGAGSAAAANGAGLTVDGANATLTYANADDSWNVNKAFNINDATGSTDSTSGALVVDGGVGIAENLYVAGLIQADTASFASINSTPIGNTTPSTGTFTTGTFNTVNTGGLQAVAIGNVTPGTGAFTSVTVGESSVGDGTVNTGTVTAGTANLTYLNVGQASALNTVTAASLQATAIGNVTPGTGAFTTLSASTLTLAALNGTVIGNVTPAAGTFTTLTAQTTTTGGLQAVAIGNATPGSAVFTTLDSTGATTLGLTSAIAINNTPIGNATPSTGAFTTLSASGTTTLNTVTGASFQGVIGNVTPAAGTFTDLVADSLDVPAINGTVIGNVTPESGAFTTLTTTSTIISAGNIVADATTDSTSNVTGAMVVKGGLGVHGNINAGTAGTSVHAIRGNLLLGIGPVSSATTALVVNLNTTTPIPGRAQVHLTPGNDRDGTYLVDSYGVGVSSTFQGRHARGTLASPSAVQAGDQLGSFHAAGYGTTGYTNLTTYEPSGVTVWAAENYTDTAQGTYVTLEVIKTGTNAAVTGLKVDSTGNVVIPSLTHSIDYTTGALVVNGGAGFNGNIHANGDCHVAGSFNGTDVGITGGFRTTLDTDTTSPGTGVLVLPGGASIGGNTYVGKNLYIGPASFEKDLAVATIIGVDNGSSFAQMAMVNSAGSGSTDFAAYTANGNDAGGWMDMGIAGNAFSDPSYTITNAQDGYLFTRPTDNSAGGNLVIATSEAGSHNDVVIGVGGFLAESEVARFHGNNSNSGTLVIKLPTNAAPAANTGAFQVWGGGSFSSNLYVGGAVTINGSQAANYDFKVAGNSSTNLLWARPSSTYDQVVIGNTLSTAGLVGGAKLLVNSTDSVILPKGTTGQRPGASGFTDVAGMFRYNTTSNSLEFYNGSIWAGIGSNFTVITDEQFNGNGIDTEFTLSASATTAACVVSINGVVQIPTLSYSISGATLTFTEAPANGDLIDVRVLVTTQMVAGIASENGFMGFQTTNSQAYITAGTDAATTVTYWDTSGAQVGSIPNVTVSTANVASTVDTFATATYRTAKYLLQATNGSNYQAMEALVIHDNTTATIVSYGIVQTGSNLGILNATVSSGNVLVQFVPAISNTKVRLSKDYLLV